MAGTRKAPVEDDARDLPPVDYERGYTDFYTYEVIPQELIPTAKRLRVKWPSFSDYLIPDHVDHWQSFRDASLALHHADSDVNRTLSDNHGDAMDAFSSFWKSKLNDSMGSMTTVGYTIQTALVAAALPILNYKKHALGVMHEFYHRETSFWSAFNRPADDEYEKRAVELEQEFGQMKTAVQQSVTSIKFAHDMLQTTYSKMGEEIKRFEANGVATWAVTIQ